MTVFKSLIQSRFRRSRSFWLASGIATSGQVQLQKCAIHGLPVTLRMLRVKSDKSDWFWSQSIVFTQPFKTGMSLGLARVPDISSARQKGPLGKRLSLITHLKRWDVVKANQSRTTPLVVEIMINWGPVRREIEPFACSLASSFLDWLLFLKI